MKTDYVDILLIHNDVTAIDIVELENGIYKEVVRLKEEGSAKFIGFSNMSNSAKSKELIEVFDFDVVLVHDPFQTAVDGSHLIQAEHGQRHHQ